MTFKKGGDILELQELYDRIQNLRKERDEQLQELERDLIDTKILIESYRKTVEKLKDLKTSI